jgi:hypothetical protein
LHLLFHAVTHQSQLHRTVAIEIFVHSALMWFSLKIFASGGKNGKIIKFCERKHPGWGKTKYLRIASGNHKRSRVFLVVVSQFSNLVATDVNGPRKDRRYRKHTSETVVSVSFLSQ